MKPLSCPYFVTTKGCHEQFPGKSATVFLRSDEVATRCTLVWLLFEGGIYFIGKPADINDGWIRYVQAIHRRMLDAGSSTCNLSVLLSAMEKSYTTRTALALAR